MILALLGLALGGVLKGATGAGAPVIAIPFIAMAFDVPFAVAMLVVPNLLTNLWQLWHFRRHRLPAPFVGLFAAAGALGVVFGSYVLASVSQQTLSLVVAFAVLSYILIRILRADWIVSYRAALRLSVPMGLVAGVLQGASGVSAPVSLSFLNAMRLDRRAFIATISVFFATMSVLQIPTLGYLGILTIERLIMSAGATLPILGFMPIGALLARRFSKEVFDRVILAVLGLLALRLAVGALT